MTLRVNLCGGGLDSAALVYASYLPGMRQPLEGAGPDMLVHIDYGQVAATAESIACENVTNVAHTNLMEPRAYRFQVHHIDGREWLQCRHINPQSELFGGSGSPFLRGRNLELTKACADYVINTQGTSETIVIQLGLCIEDMMFDDANPHYISMLDAVMQHGYGRADDGGPLVRVTAPLAEAGWRKRDLFYTLYGALIDVLGGDVMMAKHYLFEVPFSCWTPVKRTYSGREIEEPCGSCYHCQKLNTLREHVLHQYEQEKRA